jgi:GT2 family glycosyltransferase
MSEGISIIIVNWNTRDVLVECLQSIRRYTGDLDTEVIVVDNASSDGSQGMLKTMFPWVRLVASERNMGYGAANNVALSISKYPLIMLLNPDTALLPGTLETLVRFLQEHPEVGIAAPLLVGPTGIAQVSSFGFFPSPLEAALHALRLWRVAPKSGLARRFVIMPDGLSDWAYTKHLLGACLVVRRELMDQIGGFDERFFLFLEETDLCYRAGLAGWRLAYLTNTRLVHLGEQSMQGILDKSGGLYIRSYNRYCRKHGMRLPSLIMVNLFLILGTLTESAIGILKYKSARRALSSLKAFWYGYVISPIP